MSDTGTIFHSIEEIENEFEKASVDLDIILNNPDFDENEDWIIFALKKLHVLSSCFAKLSHKCQTTAKMNAKLVAESINTREDLLQAKAVASACDLETSSLIRQLHTLQLQLFSATNLNSDADMTLVKEKLQNELEVFQKEARNQSSLKEEVALLKSEKEVLTKHVSQLEEDLHGARLASKYLDKELAGRMQQLQLINQSRKVGTHEKVWRQLQAEILFNRRKTVMRACKRLSKSSDKSNGSTERKQRSNSKVRKVTIHKSVDEGLGISVTGGQEHGVPILITEVHEGGVVDREGGLSVGDALLFVNGIDIRFIPHNDAVRLLTQKTNRITLELIPTDLNPESDDDEFVFDVEVAGDGMSLQKPKSTESSTASLANEQTEPSDLSTPVESASDCGESAIFSPSSSCSLEKHEAKSSN